MRRRPLLAVEVDQPDLVAVAAGNQRAELAFLGRLHVGLAAALVGDEGHPHAAVGPRAGRRVIVVGGGHGQRRGRRQPPHRESAIEIFLGLIETDVPQADRRLARVGVDLQHGIGLRLERGEHGRGRSGLRFGGPISRSFWFATVESEALRIGTGVPARGPCLDIEDPGPGCLKRAMGHPGAELEFQRNGIAMHFRRL